MFGRTKPRNFITFEKRYSFSNIHNIHPHKLSLYKGKLIQPIGSIESNIEELKLSLKYLSSLDRFNPYMKEQVRQYIFNTFQNFGLKTLRQNFKAPYVEVSDY